MSLRPLIVCLVFLVACGEPQLEPYQSPPGRVAAPPRAAGSNALTAINTCDALLDELRAREARIIETSMSANREYAVRVAGDRENECYDPNASQCRFPFIFCAYENQAAFADDRGSAPAPQEAGAREYTTTNNQVAGVDEADFVKNDGDHLYLTADDQLLIFDAWPPQTAHRVASVELRGEPERIFLDGDRLVVLADTGDPLACSWDPYYGSSSDQSLEITVWDIANRSAPVLERRTQVSGSYVAARLIDGVVHIVVEFSGVSAAPLLVWPASLPENLCNDDISVEEVHSAFDNLRAENLTAIDALSIAQFLPGIVDEDLVGGSTATIDENLFAACEDFYAPDEAQSEGYLSLLSFPTSDDTVMGSTTVLGRFGEVYASLDNLYVAVHEYVDDPGDYLWGGRQHTRVHKFALGAGGAAASYRGSGAVAGVIINQFAMDEYNQRLRIATTEWERSSNSLFVLEESDGELVRVGEVRNIAPTEDIRAVRFDGDRGFVVTFKRTDPLFTFDLSDPHHPALLGELHIPGFSTYMHFLDPDHLLTIGFEGDDQGTFAWFQGLALQVFDVSDMTRPALVHKEVIGNRGTMSDATSDHLAFNFYASRYLLAIPMAICEGGSYDGAMTFNGLMVYSVSTEDGFSLVGQVDHRDSSANSNCENWWANPDSQVKRSVFMEDWVFSFSNTRMKVSHLDDIGSPVHSFELPESRWYGSPSCEPWW
jgi:uncharacterized secreted protein with C-terminal beta-propeller domain